MPKILIIEDNNNLALLIKQYLDKKGISADVSSDGVSALRTVAGGSYDLLLIDIKLPLMNGDEVCKKIRESTKGRDIPIILMSGVVKDPSDIDNLKKGLKLNGFLAKPFSSEKLYSMILSSLHTSPQTGTSGTKHVMQGRLEKTPFEQVLLFIMKKRGTGILHIARDTGKMKFFFLGGAPFEVSVSSEEENFGHHLSKNDLITAFELREYEERMKNQGGDPRDIFIKMGCLTPERFQEENRGFLVDRLTDCFTRKEGLFSFESAPSMTNRLHSAQALLPHIFYQGLKKHLPAELLSSFFDKKGGFFISKTPVFYEYQNHLIAEPSTADVIGLINGARTFSEIIDSLEKDDESAIAFLYTLHYLGMISFNEKPQDSDVTPTFPVRERAITAGKKEKFEDIGLELSELADELGGLGEAKENQGVISENESLSRLEEDLKREWERIKDKNYYEIFGMTPNSFSFDHLKKTYFELTKTYGPDEFFASSGEIMSLAENLLSKVSNAYETLSNVVSKENYDENLSALAAMPSGEEEKEFHVQIQFQSGKVFLEQGQYDSAVKSFTNCVNLDPDKPDYQAYLAVAIYNNPVNKGNPASVKRAKDLVNKSLQLGKLSIAYALKGAMLLDEGNLNLAEAEFSKSLKLNPNNRTALKKMEFIREKREQEKKGILQKMFR